MTGLAAVACPGGAGVTADATRRAAARIVDRCPRKPPADSAGCGPRSCGTCLSPPGRADVGGAWLPVRRLL